MSFGLFKISNASDFCDAEYASAFFDYICRHGELVLIPGTKTWPDVFEYGHAQALLASGRQTQCIGDRQLPYDVLMEQEKHSLKTETKPSLVVERVHLTKLMTASWLKKAMTDDEIENAVARIANHIANFDRLLVLRAKHGKNQRFVGVELLEIPKSLLNKIAGLSSSDFVSCRKRGDKAESSDSKFAVIEEGFRITMEVVASKINMDVARNKCVCHAQFKFDKNAILQRILSPQRLAS